MTTSIHTFVPQLRSARWFNIQQDNIANETARLSSGERLLRANDNAASIAISGGIRTKIISYNQATRNAQDGQEMLRTAEGGLDETSKMLQRMRELVMRGSNDHLTELDRAKIFDEIKNLSQDIDLVADRTHYNKIELLKGGQAATTGFTFVVNLTMEDSINVKIQAADASALGIQTSQLAVDNPNSACTTLERIDKAIEQVATIRSQIGTGIERLHHAIANLGVTTHSAMESQSIIRELDTARESVRLARDQVMSESSRAMFTQANAFARNVLELLR